MKTVTLPVSCIYKQKKGEVTISLSALQEMTFQLRALEGSHQWRESGGIMGADKEGTIVSFYYDSGGSIRATQACYRPDSKTLEAVCSKIWAPQGIRFCGIAHSHAESSLLSFKDLLFARRLLEENPGLSILYLPLFCASKLTFYAFERDFLPWMAQGYGSKSGQSGPETA